jgi:hypothetical protein
MLICSDREVLLAGYWWLIFLREKYYWLVVDNPANRTDGDRDIAVYETGALAPCTFGSVTKLLSRHQETDADPNG